jgi:signal transduction histidine kinase
MSAPRRRGLGKALGFGEGFPYLSASGLAYSVRRAALSVLAVAAFVIAVSAMFAVIEGHADAGVVFDPSGTKVVAVSPTGFAWRAGTRPGQRIVSVAMADDPGGWSLTTAADSGSVVAREGPIDDALRASMPFAVLAVGLATLALVLIRTSRAWVVPAVSASLLGASVSLFLANSDNTGLTLALAAIVPSGGLLWSLRRRRVLLFGGGLAVAAVLASWWFAWSSGTSSSEHYEQLRRAVAVGATALLILDRILARSGSQPMVRRANLARDLVSLVAVGGTMALLYLASFPAPVIVLVALLAILVAFPLRGYFGRRVEYALTADLRAQVTADVTEEERARLARELHDVPLQHLSGVIRRLELVPAASGETGALQEVADELRAVAIELHPPMLDDLGLGAALDFLSESSSTDALRVAARINDTTAPYRRPPAEVELAIYRIAHEAVTNAIKHAGASHIRIDASLAPAAIDLAVSDDGTGLSDEAARKASGGGHIGLASMRRRAQGIDADLAIAGAPGGTKVTVTWRG